MNTFTKSITLFSIFSITLITYAASTTIKHGDVIYLKAHTEKYIDVEGTKVQARWNDQADWQAMTIERDRKDGDVRGEDFIYLKSSSTGKHIDVEGTKVQARWNDQGGWQKIQIERKDGSKDVIKHGDVIYLKAHTEKHIDVEGTKVQARWNHQGDWQAITIGLPYQETDSKSHAILPYQETDSKSNVTGDVELSVKETETETEKTGPGYTIGGEGPAGGIVFHFWDDDGEHGLEAAPEDHGEEVQWGCAKIPVSKARRWGAGTGEYNTDDILEAGCSEAAELAAGYKYGGKDDWFLPSTDALEIMYENLVDKMPSEFGRTHTLAKLARFKFSGALYWSSTALPDMSCKLGCYTRVVHFYNGKANNSRRDNKFRMRAIRKF